MPEPLLGPCPEARDGLGWRLAVTFAVVAFLYLTPTPQSMATNILALTTALVDRGSLSLDIPRGMDVAERDGRILSGMPPGASFLALPVYLAARPLLRGLPFEQRLTWLHILCTLLIGLPTAAATVALSYRLLRGWGRSVRPALLAASLLAFGTMHFGYATGYYKKIPAGLCLLLALAILASRSDRLPARRGALLAGGLCGLAISLDYPTAIPALALAAYAVRRPPRLAAAVCFLAGGALALAPALAYHAAAFGSPWTTAYRFRIHPEGNLLGPPDPARLALLAGSLLLASPCLLWAIRGWARAVRQPALRTEMLVIGVSVLGTLLFFSSWSSPYPHEASFASRLILPILPLAALPMAFGLPESLHRGSLLAIGWSVAATFLAAQAAMIPSHVNPPVYALKLLATSWGTGPLFSHDLALRLGLPTLHLLIAGKSMTSAELLQPEKREILLRAVYGQAAIKLFSLSVSMLAAAGLWRWVWRPALPALQGSWRTKDLGEGE